MGKSVQPLKTYTVQSKTFRTIYHLKKINFRISSFQSTAQYMLHKIWAPKAKGNFN